MGPTIQGEVLGRLDVVVGPSPNRVVVGVRSLFDPKHGSHTVVRLYRRSFRPWGAEGSLPVRV